MASFILKIGSLDLSAYVRAQDGDGLEPYDGDVVDFQFAVSPLTDGGHVSLESAGVAERIYPLFLNERSVASVRTLEQQITRELARAPERALLEWRPPGSSQSTFYDVEAGRFEPTYNLRRDEAGWLAGALRIWTGPYGETGTEALVATALGSGPMLTVSAPSLAGDIPALLSAAISTPSAVPTDGRIIGVSVLSSPSYVPEFRAASLTDRAAAATLRAESGAVASNYLAVPVGRAGASGVAAKVPLGGPTPYTGANRVLALARVDPNLGLPREIGVVALDVFGEAIGPTAIATTPDWALVDLGVLNIDPDLPGPTDLRLSLVAGGLATLGAGASTPFHVTDVFVLPEAETAFLADEVTQAAQDGSYYEADNWQGHSD